MANYELTVSMGYVPTWTHVDAVREIFQNAKDEETVNPENKMFFDYNGFSCTIYQRPSEKSIG